jgi:hypothetical protein
MAAEFGSLLELLRVQNGDVVADQWSAFPTSQPTSWAEDHIGFTDLMGISSTDLPLPLLWTRTASRSGAFPR